jgi:hypothetical protein
MPSTDSGNALMAPQNSRYEKHTGNEVVKAIGSSENDKNIRAETDKA